MITWSDCNSLWLCLSSFQCHCSQMPGAKNQPATHKQRWQAVNLKELHPELCYRQIGSKVGKSQTFASKWIRLARLHNSFADQPRSGRPHKLNAKVVQHILAAPKQKQCKSAAAITARVQQKSVMKVGVSTLQRALRREGLKHLRPKVVPMLTAKQRYTRTRFGIGMHSENAAVCDHGVVPTTVSVLWHLALQPREQTQCVGTTP